LNVVRNAWRPRRPIAPASPESVSRRSSAAAIAAGSRGSTASPQPTPSTISCQRGMVDATTGSPAAMYS
jgi:hypothetical protein